MNLNEFYVEVARVADTEAQHVGADEVARVLACAFSVLADKDPSYALRVVARGIEVAVQKQS